MKRIRALALGPFDYAHEQYQPSLWVGEGWTQYYGQMVMLRGGITDRASLYAVMGGVVQSNLTAPGRKEVSARMSSFEAPFFDGAPRGQNTNRAQTFFSYYTKGSGLALALDLMIRDATNNAHSLDDALRALKHLSWDQPRASYYLQGRGYTEADVERAVSQAIGKDMHPWFERYVGGTEDVPFDDLLARVGVRVDRSTSHWTLVDMPNATEHQVMLRNGWLTDAK
jgi:predicted metalloprotease with PDZ domain